MLNSQEEDMNTLQKVKTYPESIFYIGIAISFILGSTFFIFNDYLIFHSDFAFDILLHALLIFVPIVAFFYMILLYKLRQNSNFEWGFSLWFIGLCLIFLSSYHFQSAFINARATPTIILLFGISLLQMVPWLTIKADNKLRGVGLLLSLEPFVVFYLYFNLVTYPFSGNSFTMGITNFTLWGSLYVLSGIVSICLALLAWHVRKNMMREVVDEQK